MDDKFDVIKEAFKKYFYAEEAEVRIGKNHLKVRIHNPTLISSAVIEYAKEEISENSLFGAEIQHGPWEYKRGIFTILIKEYN